MADEAIYRPKWRPATPAIAKWIKKQKAKMRKKTKSMTLSIGDIVTVPIKNRWGIDCAATIVKVHADSVDATVWNMGGPGADILVKGIPNSDCVVDDRPKK